MEKQIEMLSMSDIAKAGNTNLQEITENAARSTKDLITQFKMQKTLPMREFLGLDKQLKSIRRMLKVEMAKKIKLQQWVEKKNHRLGVI